MLVRWHTGATLPPPITLHSNQIRNGHKPPTTTFPADSSGTWSWAWLNFSITLPITCLYNPTPIQQSELHGSTSRSGPYYRSTGEQKIKWKKKKLKIQSTLWHSMFNDKLLAHLDFPRQFLLKFSPQTSKHLKHSPKIFFKCDSFWIMFWRKTKIKNVSWIIRSFIFYWNNRFICPLSFWFLPEAAWNAGWRACRVWHETAVFTSICQTQEKVFCFWRRF